MSKKDKKAQVVQDSVKVTPVVEEELAISIDLAITKEDIIAIKVAELEGALTDRKGELGKLLKENAQAQEDTRKEIAEQIEAHVESKLAERVEALGDELRDLGFKIDASYSFTHSQDRINYTLHASAKENQGRAPKETLKGHFGIHGKFKHDEATIGLQGKLEGLAEHHVELTEKMFEVRKRLQELPRTERQARAALAKSILSGTERGRSLLSDLANNLDLRLPMLSPPAQD
jgi:hypothetical protein